jgi:hypothetical protein
MLKTIINLATRFTGLGKLWSVIDGYKTYAGGAAQMQAGAAAVLAGASAWADKIASAESLGAIVDIAKHAQNDPASLVLLGGIATFGSGLAKIGQRHATEKQGITAPPAAGPAQ